ncbi:MFS transporter [Botrimarina mediterranea]|uniref:Glycerol-3-phosphate transporter n=1 Tax=Botrimarina mediterranea TaxID=2528022 RepID=A0A518K7Z7_9BACT|nr:MFS transporter [Botrimarina mediterranea]QDV73905.1 Glycerol-3-phosphate transporter [Botrimarina mediterranea]QDV78535.1 Glycerol-3-phosphate transporter [Planctomycetes bacterium K2D]
MTGLATDDDTPAHRYWRRRILITTIIGYALYYFVRKNLSVAMPVMESQLGVSKSDLGLFLTLHGLLYGVSKFANGVIGDRVNARWFMAAGLAICAVINIAFGLASSVVAFGVLWMANGWFQGIGFPPCARLMTHWFPPHRLATMMSVWNSSHSLGAGAVVILCGYLAPIDWRLCFFVPAGIALLGAGALAIFLRDTPESLGLAPVQGTLVTTADASEPVLSVLRSMVLSNPSIWLLAIANFFVYAVRYGILDWGPTFLKQARGVELTSAGWMIAAFEAAGILGMLSSGWITDRFFAGRGARACLVYMTCCTAALAAFWLLPDSSTTVCTALLVIAGFFIYGPQCLVGICVANLATKRAAASAVGLTGLFGYLSTVLSGVGIGWLVERHGWDAGFAMFFNCGVVGALLFALCWRAKAHGY